MRAFELQFGQANMWHVQDTQLTSTYIDPYFLFITFATFDHMQLLFFWHLFNEALLVDNISIDLSFSWHVTYLFGVAFVYIFLENWLGWCHSCSYQKSTWWWWSMTRFRVYVCISVKSLKRSWKRLSIYDVVYVRLDNAENLKLFVPKTTMVL